MAMATAMKIPPRYKLSPLFVVPAKAGSQGSRASLALDSCFRGNDGWVLSRGETASAPQQSLGPHHQRDEEGAERDRRRPGRAVEGGGDAFGDAERQGGD